MIIASGGGFVLIILVVILLIAGMFGSAFGFLFSNETPKTEESMSVNSAVNFLDNEIDEEIVRIKSSTDYDTVRIDNRSVVWREVLSVYTVVTTNRENKFNIMEMKIEYSKFDEIFETKTNFYLMIAKNQGYMLPKSDMPSELEEFIRNIKL